MTRPSCLLFASVLLAGCSQFYIQQPQIAVSGTATGTVTGVPVPAGGSAAPAASAAPVYRPAAPSVTLQVGEERFLPSLLRDAGGAIPAAAFTWTTTAEAVTRLDAATQTLRVQAPGTAYLTATLAADPAVKVVVELVGAAAPPTGATPAPTPAATERPAGVATRRPETPPPSGTPTVRPTARPTAAASATPSPSPTPTAAPIGAALELKGVDVSKDVDGHFRIELTFSKPMAGGTGLQDLLANYRFALGEDFGDTDDLSSNFAEPLVIDPRSRAARIGGTDAEQKRWFTFATAAVSGAGNPFDGPAADPAGTIYVEVDSDDPARVHIWIKRRPNYFANVVSELKVTVRGILDPGGQPISTGTGKNVARGTV